MQMAGAAWTMARPGPPLHEHHYFSCLLKPVNRLIPILQSRAAFP